MAELLSARNVVKHYGGTCALKGVDFAVEAGKVSVLIGENGAGKSTLMKIIAGVERPTGGELLVDGRPVTLESVRDAARLGIGMVHQELNLCPNLSIAQNIFLLEGPDGAGKLLHPGQEAQEARALLARLGQSINVESKVEDLSVGQQQIVEIAKALAANARILILDEPTSALSDAEVEVLFRVIQELKAAGVGIVYISHRLQELLRVGDVISILRDGEMVATSPVADVSVDWIIEKMIGDAAMPARSGDALVEGEPVLEFENVALHRSHGGAALEAVNVCCGQGSVVAIYGLLGSGRTEMLEIAIGARKPGIGRVKLCGADVTGLSIADRVERGLLFVSEDRKALGLFANLSVGGNMSVSNLARLARFGIVSRQREEGAISALIARLAVKAGSIRASVGSLSGGNQQKVLIGRALMPGPKVLLLDEPSRGVDVGARAELFKIIRDLARDGLGVVFTTSDVHEALGAAERILVISGGRITLDTPAVAADETMLVKAANAHAAQPKARTA